MVKWHGQQYYMIIEAIPINAFYLLAPDGTRQAVGGLGPGGGDIARLEPIKPYDPGYEKIVRAFCRNEQVCHWLATNPTMKGLKARDIAREEHRGIVAAFCHTLKLTRI